MATEQKKTAAKGEKVKGREDTLIEYTDKSRFHKAGDKATVHRIQAERLIKKGVAKRAKSTEE